jgi:D-3-phosphoglycerate dehydrogenase
MARGFSMEVRAFDPFLAAQGWPEGAVRRWRRWPRAWHGPTPCRSKSRRADRPLLGEAELARLRPGAILVNTARGGVVEEAALARALASGRVAAAGIDVFDAEPPPAHHPLLAFDQVIASPHIAGLTAQAAERMAVASVRNALDYLEGRLDPALLVNRAALA